MTSNGRSAWRCVLLGDSIFDNGKYVRDGQSVPELLLRQLGDDWSVENHAVDGNLVELVDADVLRSEPDTTVVCLSVGGNDAIWNVDLLSDPTPRPAIESIARLQAAVEEFAGQYAALVETICDDLGLRLVGCTIYQPVMDEFPQAATAGALAMFNDAITRCLHRRGCVWVELRNVCNAPEHFTNIIEPSALGGERIADALARRVRAGIAT